MKPKTFIAALDDDEITAAVSAAERQSSGEIVVFIDSKTVSDAMSAARATFERLGLEKTRDRNGVLIYFAPDSQKFAVLGDAGIHAKGGEVLWVGIRDEMLPFLREGKYTDAILLAVRRVGEVLARHFPRRPDDQNELPDRVERG
jgi:uncharacterized membrane protein